MFKRSLAIFITVILVFGTSSPTLVHGSPQDNISQNKVKFLQLNDKILETNLQISNLNQGMEKLNDSIKKNDIAISENEKKIKSAETQVESLRKEVGDSQKLADERVRAMYKIGFNKGYISVILTARGLSDFMSKLQAIQRIISLDTKVLNKLKLSREKLDKTLAELNLDKNTLQELKASNLASLQQLNASKRELESLVKQFNEEKKKAALIIEENEEMLIAHSIAVINSPDPTINSMRSAVETLKSFLRQLNTASVKKKAEQYISTGSLRLAAMIADSTKPNDGSTETYKATYSMVATAYTGGGLTAIGLKPVRDPAGLSSIAVDPTVIPLGSKVYIPGYGYAICSDTGGAIKGHKIDIYLNSVAECLQWGRRTVTLHVIAYPGEW